jgi:uncharacterized membrane protein
MADAESIATAGTKSNAQIIYVLYLVGLLTGGLTAVLGVVMAYIGRPEAPDWLKTHYTFQVRSFWLAIAYLILGGLFAGVLVATLILMPLGLMLGGSLWLLTMVWWIVRCVQGLNLMSQNQPIPKPEGWIFAS